MPELLCACVQNTTNNALYFLLIFTTVHVNREDKLQVSICHVCVV